MARAVIPGGAMTVSRPTAPSAPPPAMCATTRRLSRVSAWTRCSGPRTVTDTRAGVMMKLMTAPAPVSTGMPPKDRSASAPISPVTVTCFGAIRTMPRGVVSIGTVRVNAPDTFAISVGIVVTDSMPARFWSAPTSRAMVGEIDTPPCNTCPDSGTTVMSGTTRTSAPLGSCASTSLGSRRIVHVGDESVSGMRRVKSPRTVRSRSTWLPLPEIWAWILGSFCCSVRPGGSCTFKPSSKSVVTGCCSCTATYSINERKIAAPLMGQFRVNSWIRLARIEQPPDQRLVDGAIPLRRADHLLHDDAVAVDQEALRHPRGLVAVADRAARVVQNVEREAHVVHEGHDLAGPLLFGGVERVAVDAHRHDPEVGARELLVQPLHRRHLHAAWRAPGGPHVQQDDLAAVIGQRGRAAAAQVRAVKRRRRSAHFDQVELRPQLHGEGHAEDDRHHDAGHERPLLAVCHTLTRQRRRSSPTARAGSPLVKIALPATNVSAPAWCASAIVCAVIPPSTSKKHRALCVVRSAWARWILSFDAGR